MKDHGHRKARGLDAEAITAVSVNLPELLKEVEKR